MKLSFECNQDPRKMPNIKGKKFCSLCEKNVFDLRKKSDEKVASFYKSNPTACVIAYQDQLDKLVRDNTQTIKTRRLFPYAASLLAVSILPNLIIANYYVLRNNITQGVSQTKNDSISNLDIKTEEGKYFVNLRVKLISNKRRPKTNREIVICTSKADSLGYEEVQDTLALGILDKKGRARINVSRDVFQKLSKGENLLVRIDWFTKEKIVNIEVKDKLIEMKIIASGRSPIRGAF